MSIQLSKDELGPLPFMHDREFVFVYQMGKVGSTALCRSLDKAGIHKYAHCQWLQENTFRLLDWPPYANRQVGNPQFFVSTYNHYRDLRFHLQELNLKTVVKIITACREPVAQFLSHFFHGGGGRVDIQDRHGDYTAGLVIDYILENCQWVLERKTESLAAMAKKADIYPLHQRMMWYLILNPLRWFEDELLECIGLDVYAQPFPQTGWTLIDNRALILKFECFGDHMDQVIGDFIQRPDFEMIHANRAKDKDYADIYAEVLAKIKFPQAFLDFVYGSKYARHFYSPAEIDHFSRRWGD